MRWLEVIAYGRKRRSEMYQETERAEFSLILSGVVKLSTQLSFACTEKQDYEFPWLPGSPKERCRTPVARL